MASVDVTDAVNARSFLYHAFGVRGYECVRGEYRAGQVLFTLRQPPDESCRVGRGRGGLEDRIVNSRVGIAHLSGGMGKVGGAHYETENGTFLGETADQSARFGLIARDVSDRHAQRVRT
jgi:hypothetical protein